MTDDSILDGDADVGFAREWLESVERAEEAASSLRREYRELDGFVGVSAAPAETDAETPARVLCVTVDLSFDPDRLPETYDGHDVFVERTAGVDPE